MVKFITKDKKVIPIKEGGISSKNLKSNNSESGVDKHKALLLKDKPEMVHGEPVFAYLNHHPVTIKISLEPIDKSVKGTDLKTHDTGLKLSISASEWNLSRSDCTQCGQMQDSLKREFQDRKLKLKSVVSDNDFRKLLDIWNEYHLNDIKAGTEKQLDLISQYRDSEKYADKDVFLDRPEAILKDHNANPDGDWKYGHGFLFRPIPASEIKFIKDLQRRLNIATN